MPYKRPQGTSDILPEEIKKWRFLEEQAREVFDRYGYDEIRLPLFEHTNLFARSIGEATDIVEKEMYTFGEGKNQVSFRPEITAGLVRAYLENNMHKQRAFRKLFSIGPAFRHERPQKGRSRQFHQLDVEALGTIDPHLDAEIIIMAHQFFKKVGVENHEIIVNSTGCPGCRPAYREVLKKALSPHLAKMCENCQNRYERNVFRILDCKKDACKKITAETPVITEHLCSSCGPHHDKVIELLGKYNVPFKSDARLVRGLDYYTKTVFEIISTSDGLGSQNAIGGGGRYDGLIHELGGPELGAIGFALGVERILLAMGEENAATADQEINMVYVVTRGDEEKDFAFEVIEGLRNAGIKAEMNYEGKSMKAQMKAANKSGARFTAVIGPSELENRSVNLKNMETGEEKKVELEILAEAVDK